MVKNSFPEDIKVEVIKNLDEITADVKPVSSCRAKLKSRHCTPLSQPLTKSSMTFRSPCLRPGTGSARRRSRFWRILPP